MYPAAHDRPSSAFRALATTARALAAPCLPLGIAVAMHLYPLCALQSMPLPLFSNARIKRALLLQIIRNRRLVIANAGSERTRGADEPIVATRTADGIRLDGRCEYMSLASVANLVFFKARLADSDSIVLCAADLRTPGVQIGAWRFDGSMRMSDTCSVAFDAHLVRSGRYLTVDEDGSLQCVSAYQRAWFHLFVAEVYLARLQRLQSSWALPTSTDLMMSLNELVQLREYSLRLFDAFGRGTNMEPLTQATSALKLRVSVLAQSTATALRRRAADGDAHAPQLETDAAELVFIKWQPTADETILRTLAARTAECNRFWPDAARTLPVTP
jgi:hypothetical protein